VTRGLWSFCPSYKLAFTLKQKNARLKPHLVFLLNNSLLHSCVHSFTVNLIYILFCGNKTRNVCVVIIIYYRIPTSFLNVFFFKLSITFLYFLLQIPVKLSLIIRNIAIYCIHTNKPSIISTKLNGNFFRNYMISSAV
jgi:hypothetical protein